ncbi:adaptor protein MecA [Alteribacter natronophilus]|uniref:adaptor protein MecA n=1 Tax=Alteribacter natronophilus TaxID=2583810 RepID=UPI00110E15BB|nr:adaptor protein MecA [Alteribacter natronophilus]TMW72931.1 adaptor protein MecA [Alteribacter natronophilus]
MEIERVNDTTLKFFITYKDIEKRGFDKDEIWYNRERGEELFFEMMNEANDQENFEIDGPLWVQVHALERGLEVIVTRGQVNDGNVKLEIPVGDEKDAQSVDDNIAEMLEGRVRSEDEDGEKELTLSIVIGFNDFEDVISLSKAFDEEVETSLYHFEGRYYIYVTLDERFTDEEQDNHLSRMLEYGYESDITIHRIREYGKEIVGDNALKVISGQFN